MHDHGDVIITEFGSPTDQSNRLEIYILSRLHSLSSFVSDSNTACFSVDCNLHVFALIYDVQHILTSFASTGPELYRSTVTVTVSSVVTTTAITAKELDYRRKFKD